MYQKRVIKSVEHTENGVRINVDLFNVTTPKGCELDGGEKVKIITESRLGGEYLMTIVSEICRDCPLMGKVCQYGQAP